MISKRMRFRAEKSAIRELIALLSANQVAMITSVSKENLK